MPIQKRTVVRSSKPTASNQVNAEASEPKAKKNKKTGGFTATTLNATRGFRGSAPRVGRVF